jgi:hypothetical protein
MALRFDGAGRLPPGVHWVTWRAMVLIVGFNAKRLGLLKGLRQALVALKAAGCQTIYAEGSFVTAKLDPGDFDACWAVDGVDAKRLDPVFLDFSNSRAAQKARFGGELFPAELPEGLTGRTFLDFFQKDRDTGAPKGILALDLRRWHP